MTSHSSSFGIFTRALPLLFLCFLSTPFQVISSIHAQIAPIPNTRMPYAQVGSKFYVQSGPRSANNTSVFSLDLTTSWSVDTPAWTAEAFGDIPNDPDSWAVTDDRSLVIHYPNNGTFKRVNITNPNAQWRTIDFFWTQQCLHFAHEISMDLRTGWTYTFSMDLPTSMCVDQRISQSPYIRRIPDDLFGQRMIHGAVYNSARASFMLGYRRLMDNVWGYLLEYSIDANSWSLFNVIGEEPTFKRENCMAIDANGTKIAVFGGIPGWAEPPTPELYVLDLNSKEWRKAPNATSPRSFPACALVGDQFIIWGGQNTKNPSGDGSMLLFDLSKFEWVTTYTPPSYLLPTKPTTTASPGASVTSEAPAPTKHESSSINIGAIIGGVIGALAAIAIVAGVFIYRRRKQKNQKSEIPGTKDVKQGHAPPEHYGKQEHGLMEGVSEDYGKTPVYSPQLVNVSSRHPQQTPILGRDPHGEPAPKYEATEH